MVILKKPKRVQVGEVRSNLVWHEQDQLPVLLDKLQTHLRNHGICQLAFVNAAF